MQNHISPEFLEEFKAVARILGSDAEILMENAEKKKIDFWRRTIIRGLSADIEAMCFQLRNGLRLEINNRSIAKEFSDDEKLIIKNIDSRWFPPERLRSVVKGFGNRFRFTIEMLHKLNGRTFTMQKESNEWESFLEFIKIRNRTVHPESANDLKISDSEKDLILYIGDWYKIQLDNSTRINSRNFY
jgi:hypothetical protein